MSNRITLKLHIEKLLNEGKRANHPDFEPFFRLFGKEKIIQLALEIKEEQKLAAEKEPCVTIPE